MDHRAFFSLPEPQSGQRKKSHQPAQGSTQFFAPIGIGECKVRAARPARSAVPPSVAFEQPQTADGKPPSGQAAAGQTQTQHDRRRGVERHPETGRARRAGGERCAARRSSGGAAAEAKWSLCAGRSSSRTIDEETSQRENENDEAERAITFLIKCPG